MQAARHRHALIGLAAAALLALVVAPAQADDEVGEWLDRMARAIDSLNYRGTLVHMRDGRVDTLRVIHRADENGIRERIYSVDGQPREVLRDGSRVRTLIAGDQPLVVQGGIGTRLLPNLPVSQLSSPIVAYRMRFAGSERVAGMQARIIEIRPRDQFRYGHRLWLEERTGMLLRSALLDRRGGVLQKMTFVEIELGVRISDQELAPDPAVRDAAGARMDEQTVPEPAAAAELRKATWKPARLPDGFRLASVGQGMNPDDRAFEHLLFSDGLASFSVYVEEAGRPVGSERIESIGPVHVYTGMVEKHRVTVVGEVPSATVALVAKELQRRQ